MATTAVKRSRLTFAEARHRVLAAAPLLSKKLGRERVVLEECLGRVLAEPLIADTDFPAFDNSAMDGYAVRSVDIATAAPGNRVRLEVTEVVAAGHLPSAGVTQGTAIRVMTGAPIPRGADCVVMRENTEERETEVFIEVAATRGENVRPAGEDVRLGEIVLAAGRLLCAGDVAALAAFGHPKV